MVSYLRDLPLGETVCFYARTASGGPRANLRFGWVDPHGTRRVVRLQDGPLEIVQREPGTDLVYLRDERGQVIPVHGSMRIRRARS